MSFELHLGDCLDPVTGLGSLADQSVDHVISDPPFEVEAHTLQRRKKGKAFNTARAVEECPLDFAPITEEIRVAVAAQMARVARRWIAVFCQAEAVSAWREVLVDAGAVYKRACVWLKPDGQPQLTGDRPGMGYESIVLAHAPGRSRWNAGGKHGVYTFPIRPAGVDRDGRVHPTQKPLALMEALVRDFTDPGDLILDPFAGSGSTGVAALGLGRRFCGWEMSPVHHATALRRLSETREQPSLLAKLPKRKQMGMGL